MTASSDEQSQDLTDLQVRYSTNHILRYEFIWGTGWVSPGGEHASRTLCESIASALKDSRVLDIGSGTGGAAFMMAEDFETSVVHGVDIAKSMVDLCVERRPDHLEEQVQFKVTDFMSPPVVSDGNGDGPLDTPATFNVIWSRDSFLHIDDKDALLKKCHEQLAPGGTILFTDYCMPIKPVSECSHDFQEYLTGRGYVLFDVDNYGEVMKQAGFENVKTEDRTTFFVKCLKDELAMLQSNKSTFLEKFTQEDYDELEAGWQSKIKWCSEGDMCWGVMEGNKATS